MKILEINISDYRNINRACAVFSPSVNFIYGKNAQGKTNFIEAVWMFTGARSFRGTKDGDLVNFEKTSAKPRAKRLCGGAAAGGFEFQFLRPKN